MLSAREGLVSDDTLLKSNLWLQELATAVSMGLDLTILILNDDAYGMIKWKQVGTLDCN